MHKQTIFITGQPRSGTSLLCEIVGHYPQICAVQQPLPLVLYHLADLYHKQQNKQNYYPITPLFLEDFDEQNWLYFLQNQQLDQPTIADLAKQSQNYSGVYSPNYLSSLKVGKQSTLKELITTKERIAIKEVFAEDWIPYFLELQLPTLLIIRDPRDVIASLLQGEQMGDLRGFYYHLLMWRKSVAFALNYQSHHHFKFIQLKHLLNELPHQLTELAQFLGTDDFPAALYNNELLSQWAGNSNVTANNTNKISRESNRADFLTIEQIQFIETVCYAEMKTLGYKLSTTVKELVQNIESINDPVPFDKKDFPSRWLWNKTSQKNEITRLSLLLNKDHQEKQILSQHFIFLSSFKQLQQSVR